MLTEECYKIIREGQRTKEKQTFSVNRPAFLKHWAMSPED